jgi:hypothetical protein
VGIFRCRWLGIEDEGHLGKYNVSAITEPGFSKVIGDSSAVSALREAYLLRDKTDIRRAWEGSGSACSPETYPATKLHGVTGPKILLVLNITLYRMSE